MLLFVGVVLTLLTQSSSATVAVALTALNTGQIDLPQATAAIIGADVGTTVKAALATIGGNTGSRRTGFAHVIYNLMTGIGAFLLLPAYLWAWETFGMGMTETSPEVVAVAFHSAFNAIGVIVALPFTYRFARMIERLFPEREDPLIASLDERLLGDPIAAAGALESSSRAISAAVLRATASRLSGGEVPPPDTSFDEIFRAVTEARSFAVKTGEVTDENDIGARKLFAMLYMIDHGERLAERAGKKDRLEGIALREDMQARGRELADNFVALAEDIETPGPLTALPPLEIAAAELEADKPQFRKNLIVSAARGELSGEELDSALDGARWLRRLAYHAWRMAVYWSEIEEAR